MRRREEGEEFLIDLHEELSQSQFALRRWKAVDNTTPFRMMLQKIEYHIHLQDG